MKKLVYFLLLFPYLLVAKPKLFIGIVVDQMRYDYLTKFKKNYSNKGFNRLISQGFIAHQLTYNYYPTFTGPGHVSIFTGTTPSASGIVGNNWYDNQKKETVYCTDDENAFPIGENVKKNKMSPSLSHVNTVGDELKLFTLGKGKVFAISMKDRASILPAGKAANAAYWFDSESRQFITCNFYSASLPDYVKKFNAKRLDTDYINKGWNLLLTKELYTIQKDASRWEGTFKPDTSTSFPHNLKNSTERELIRKTPFANTISKEFAKEIIREEGLGKDEIVDFLSISFSAPDYIGHKFGISSLELEDTYVRLDRDIADLLEFLDKEIGSNQYSLFLTADHGASYGVLNNQDFKIPSETLDEEGMTTKINDILNQKFGFKPILKIINQNVYIDEVKAGSSLMDMQKIIEKQLYENKFIKRVYHKEDLLKGSFPDEESQMYVNGFYPNRSGNMIYSTVPNIVEYEKTGTSHGTTNSYDTRVPLIFFGNGVPKGKSTFKKYHIVDIAPTTSQIMEIPFPGSTSGKLIEEIFQK